MVSKHKDELEEISSSIDIEWKERQLQLFEEYVKKEYKKYLEQFSVDINDVSSKNELKNEFVSDFLKVSVNNLVPAKMSFYFIISLLLKGNIHFPIYKIKLDDNQYYKVIPAIHIFWSQDSSSGKSEGKDFVKNLMEVISNKIGEKYGISDGFFSLYNIDWTETPQAFINHFEVKQTKKGIQYNFDNVVKGIFESTDAIFSDESAYLLEEKIYSTQSISELLLTALEGRPIDKTLVGWNGRITTTNPKFLFYGVSRPITKMSEGFLEKGLFQRMLAYFREITTEQRVSTFSDLVDMKHQQPNVEKLSDRFVELYEWKVKNIVQPSNYEFIVWDTNKFKEYFKTKGKSVMEYISKEVKSWTMRKVMITFASRYYMKIALSLFILEAFSRRQFTITQDVMDNVFNLLDDLLKNMIIFAEYNLIEPKKIINQKRRLKKAIFEYFKSFNITETDKLSLMKFLQTRLELSPEFIEDALYKFHYDGLIKIESNKIRFGLLDTYKQIAGGRK